MGEWMHLMAGGASATFHVEQLRYYVIELKTGKFQPEYVGKPNFYIALS